MRTSYVIRTFYHERKTVQPDRSVQDVVIRDALLLGIRLQYLRHLCLTISTHTFSIFSPISRHLDLLRRTTAVAQRSHRLVAPRHSLYCQRRLYFPPRHRLQRIRDYEQGATFPERYAGRSNLDATSLPTPRLHGFNAAGKTIDEFRQ